MCKTTTWHFRFCPLTAPLLLLLSVASLADVVVPSDRVTTRVIERELPSGNSQALGSLRPGEELPYLGSVPNWYTVPFT